MQSFSTLLWIILGGAIGTAFRYGASGLVARHFGEAFPWGTLAVNVAGSFVIGVFAALTGPDGRVLVGPAARQFVMIGVCGGFTTFSSFSLQTLSLVRDGEWLGAGLNVLGSVIFCMAGVWAGHVSGEMWNQR